MSKTVISVENLSKSYRLGQIGTGTLSRDLNVWWAKARGKPNPLLKIGQVEHGNQDGEMIWALKDVSFQVEQGEVLGIIGRNGAGKSTLLKILSRVTAPTSGEVKVKGRIASLLEVGTGFHPELTGRENIYLNGAILGMTKEEVQRKFDEIVSFAEIEKFIDTPVKRYSSGMYVRLAFAVAAHLEADILLVDEVLAVGDAQFQRKCLGKMGDVASKEGRTVLFVSHNMAAVEGLCSKAIVLSQGSLLTLSEVHESIKFYYKTDERKLNISLRERNDRQGEGNIRATEIHIIDKTGQKTNFISMGDSFTVEIRVQGALRSGIVGVLIGNQFKSQLIRGYTWENLTESVSVKGKSVLKCHFEDFPLINGTYYIHIWIAEREGNYNRLEDYVENAATLEINAVDVYGNGRILDSKTCVAFCRTKWEIYSENS
ncbi:MAG: ABC transporter ATP-binding protein [Pelolinea sp.]|nr:ABC transporter ATP-binding protein [Pelolinea sp.]